MYLGTVLIAFSLSYVAPGEHMVPGPFHYEFVSDG
jgi:hypothetical protein